MAFNNETERLLNLVLKNGFEYKIVTELIKKEILIEFQKESKVKNVEVLIDFAEEKIVLLNEDVNLITDKFQIKAIAIARKVMLDLLEDASLSQKDNKFDKLGTRVEKQMINISWSKLGSFFFWVYHLYFVFIIAIWTWMIIVGGELRDWKIGELFTFEGVMNLLVMVTPLIVIGYVIKNKLKGDALAKILLIWEVPWIVVGILFGQIFRSAIPIWQLFGICVLLMSGLNYWKINLNVDVTNKNKIKIGFFSLIWWLLLVVLGYVVVFWSFFVPGIFISLVKMLFDFSDYSRSVYLGGLNLVMIIELSLVVGGKLLFVGACLIGGLVPFILFKQILGKFVGVVKVVRNYKNEFQLTLVSLSGLLLILVMGWVLYQPNYGEIEEKLNKFATASVYEEKLELAKILVNREVEIKQIIKDASFADNRYIFDKTVKPMMELYTDVLEIDEDNSFLNAINNMFMIWASPMVYRGPSDVRKMSNAYLDLYGHSYYQDLNVKEVKNVHVINRRYNILSQDDLWATVSVEDEFENISTEQQEVVYEFSLPEDAVITDLKLGDALQFSGIVAPRGAASQTYQQQLQVNRDPALLEQTGIRQFRLRVFPVPSKNDSTTLGGRNQRVKFSYITMIDNGSVGLPVYTNENNVNLINTRISGEVDGVIKEIKLNDSAVSMSVLQDCKSWQERIALWSGNENQQLSALVGSLNNFENELGAISCRNGSWEVNDVFMENKKIAILYDASWSNRDNGMLEKLKLNLKNNGNWVNKNNVDWLTFNYLISNPVRLETTNFEQLLDVTYFGKKDLVSVLRNFDSSEYDWVVIVTDNQPITLQSNQLPNWRANRIDFLHDGGIPSYSNDVLKFVLANNGSVSDSWNELFVNYKNYLIGNRINLAVTDFESFLKEQDPSGKWSQVITDEQIDVATLFPEDYKFDLIIVNDVAIKLLTKPNWEGWKMDDRTRAQLKMNLYSNQTNLSTTSRWLVNRYLVDVFGKSRGDLRELNSVMDKLNVLANDARVVTPVSSMIALVNFQQLEELKRNMESSWRFTDRPTLANPSNVPVWDNWELQSQRMDPFVTPLNKNLQPNLGLFDGFWGGQNMGLSIETADGGNNSNRNLVGESASGLSSVNAGWFVVLLVVPLAIIVVLVALKWLLTVKSKK